MGKVREECAISVIVPVYNAGKYIKKCIKSLVRQTFHDFEIVAVDDGSTDQSASVLRALAKEYDNIRIVTHQKNCGLFRARITGVENSKGKYIAFVDADDAVSVDWLRLLYDKICGEGADIAIGQFAFEFENEKAGYNNLDPLRAPLTLEGEDVFAAFMRQQGLFFSWHVVWNKLYSRALWDAALPALRAFSERQGHLVLYEDLAFSAAMWARAKKVCNVTSGALYFYYKHAEAATAFAKSRGQFEKKIGDAKAAFGFLKEVLQGTGRAKLFERDYAEWVCNHACILYHAGGNLDRKYRERVVTSAFGIDAAEILDQRRKKSVDFFGSIFTGSNRDDLLRLDGIKRRICSRKISVVSFDIFDTLLLRPFYTPSDLFCLLDDDFRAWNGNTSFVQFSQMRRECERYCREELRNRKDGAEEVTLDEIYACIAERYGLGAEVTSKLKERELSLEMRLCYARKSGKQLYDLARQQGKKVVLCSDIYLPQEFVAQLLKKNGYEGHILFLSSEARLTKHRGSLFHYVRKQLRAKPEEILHIGDNVFSDFEQAIRAGWNAMQLPRAVDVFEGSVAGLYGGELMRDIALNAQNHDMESAQRHLGYRTALAFIANKLFDDPFLCFNRETNFNADPYLLGYAALGPYLYAVTDWIMESVAQKGCGTIHFVARDGYLPKLAYEIMSRGREDLPKTNYLYLSRRALVLADVANRMDLYALSEKMNPLVFSRKKLYALLLPVLKEEYAAGAEAFRRAAHLTEPLFEKYFADRKEFEDGITEYLPCIDAGKLRRYREELAAYFGEQIEEGDLLFDIGYSGRCEAALTSLLGFPVNSLYVHGNEEVLLDRQRQSGFKTETFYRYKPAITGVVREHVFMKLSPSAIGYEKKGGALQPVFEQPHPESAAEQVTSLLQRAALDFVRQMTETFGADRGRLPYRGEDLAYIFEYYLHFSRPLDQQVLCCVQFEDSFGLGKRFELVDFWRQELENHHLTRRTSRPPARSRIRRWADKFLPLGSRRREFFKKLYYKLLD